MEKISLHPVWEETWDLLPFSPGWKQRCLPPRMSVTEKLSSPVKCSGLLDPGSRVTFAELRKQTPAFWEGLTSPWEELAPGRSKPEFPSLVYGTYTGTPTLCRGWWVWVRWGKWSAGIYVAATNETPPCSWSACWNMGEIWPLWNWGDMPAILLHSKIDLRGTKHGVF